MVVEAGSVFPNALFDTYTALPSFAFPAWLLTDIRYFILDNHPSYGCLAMLGWDSGFQGPSPEAKHWKSRHTRTVSGFSCAL